MAPEERQAFSRFMEAAPDSDAYSHLNISVRDKGYRIGIPYNLPNTHFGTRLGSRHAAVIFHELRQSPYYADHAYQLLRLSRTSRCHGDPAGKCSRLGRIQPGTRGVGDVSGNLGRPANK